jgi:thiol-disulfide isomerase/thioredoxin
MKKNYLLAFIFLFLACEKSFDAPFLHISLKDPKGKNHTISDYRGKILILDFWASWCEPCKKVVPILEQIKKKSDPKKTVLLGINTDNAISLEEIIQTAKDFKIEYPYLLDPEFQLVKELNLEGQPALFIFDKTGKLVFHQYGLKIRDFNGIVKKIQDLENE